MCGISCILSLASHQHHRPHDQPNGAAHINGDRREALATELNASLDQIKHRGPDSCGNWISDDCRVGTLASSNLNSLPTRHKQWLTVPRSSRSRPPEH